MPVASDEVRGLAGADESDQQGHFGRQGDDQLIVDAHRAVEVLPDGGVLERRQVHELRDRVRRSVARREVVCDERILHRMLREDLEFGWSRHARGGEHRPLEHAHRVDLAVRVDIRGYQRAQHRDRMVGERLERNDLHEVAAGGERALDVTVAEHLRASINQNQCGGAPMIATGVDPSGFLAESPCRRSR